MASIGGDPIFYLPQHIIMPCHVIALLITLESAKKEMRIESTYYKIFKYMRRNTGLKSEGINASSDLPLKIHITYTKSH